MPGARFPRGGVGPTQKQPSRRVSQGRRGSSLLVWVCAASVLVYREAAAAAAPLRIPASPHGRGWPQWHGISPQLGPRHRRRPESGHLVTAAGGGDLVVEDASGPGRGLAQEGVSRLENGTVVGTKEGFVNVDFGYPGLKSWTTGAPFDFEWIPDVVLPLPPGSETFNISSNPQAPGYNFARPFDYMETSLRAFAADSVSCFNVSVPAGRYLLRLTFWYSNYDGKNKPPGFTIAIGLTQVLDFQLDPWMQNIPEFIVDVLPPLPDQGVTPALSLCFIPKTGRPILNGLELRPLPSTSYQTPPLRQGQGPGQGPPRRAGEDVWVLCGPGCRLACAPGLVDGSAYLRYPYDPHDRAWYVDSQIAGLENTDNTFVNSTSSTVPARGLAQANDAPDFLTGRDRTTDRDGTPLVYNFVAWPADWVLTLYVGNFYPKYEGPGDVLLRVSVNGRTVVPSQDVFSAAGGVRGAAGGFSFRFKQALPASSGVPQPGMNLTLGTAPGSRLQRPLLSGLEMFYVVPATPAVPLEQVLALRSFQAGVGYPEALTSWHGDPCSPNPWLGVNCTQRSNSTVVISLSLASLQLVGPIASQLALVDTLQSIVLANNSLLGPIPRPLFFIPSLTVLDVSDNNLVGPVPGDIPPSLNFSASGNPSLCSAAGGNSLPQCPVPSPPVSPSDSGGTNSTSLIIALVVGLVAGVAIVAGLILCCVFKGWCAGGRPGLHFGTRGGGMPGEDPGKPGAALSLDIPNGDATEPLKEGLLRDAAGIPLPPGATAAAALGRNAKGAGDAAPGAAAEGARQGPGAAGTGAGGVHPEDVGGVWPHTTGDRADGACAAAAGAPAAAAGAVAGAGAAAAAAGAAVALGGEGVPRGSGAAMVVRLPPGSSVRQLSYEEIAAATGQFSPEQVIGSGGFGPVFRGQLEDGRAVAVKKRDDASLQGDDEFFNEVELLSRAWHPNLVELIGFCQDRGHQILVYQFMPNGTVRDHLYDAEGTPVGHLRWIQRLQIALGAAKGIDYLHNGPKAGSGTDSALSIIHRDIKTSNILLGPRLEAKVADFGLSRVKSTEQTHVSTNVKGTAGYLDPEYYMVHQLTDKSDVFSFGVVLLELISGRQPVNLNRPRAEWSIIDWARAHLQTGDVHAIIDPTLSPDEYDLDTMWKVAEVGILCVEPMGLNRPSIEDVVKELQEAIEAEVAAGHGASVEGAMSSEHADRPPTPAAKEALKKEEKEEGTSGVVSSMTSSTSSLQDTRVPTDGSSLLSTGASGLTSRSGSHAGWTGGSDNPGPGSSPSIGDPFDNRAAEARTHWAAQSNSMN